MKILIPRAASSRWASAYSSRARRRAECLVSPMEAVTFSKQEKLRKTALCYLQEHPEAQALQPRFDVAAVWTDDAGKTVLESHYLPGAF